MRSNPFKKIYDICNSGDSRHKLKNLPDFPRYFDVELTNTCNFRCLMCNTGILAQQRETGFMSDEVYYKFLDEIKDYKTPIRFIRWGEPTLHPKIIEYMKAAKKHGLLCHLNTNGSKVDDQMIKEFIELPLDSIKFSFQGIDRKSYLEMRSIDFFDGLMEVVKKLYESRGDNEPPYIHISTTITYETAEQVEHFKKYVSSFVDLVTVGRTMLEHLSLENMRLGDEDRLTLKRLKGNESVIKKHPECPEVFDKLSINWDGSISACCSDYDNKMIVGNLKKEPVKVIWKSEKLNDYRTILADMRHDEIELCKHCYDFQSLQNPGLQQT